MSKTGKPCLLLPANVTPATPLLSTPPNFDGCSTTPPQLTKSDNVPDTTSVVIIKTLYHLSLTIDRLEEEVNQQRAEFSNVFNYAIENQQLQQHLKSSQ